ncbi:MAG: DUF3500 domain-containing protein [Caldilineaceae bacterium]
MNKPGIVTGVLLISLLVSSCVTSLATPAPGATATTSATTGTSTSETTTAAITSTASVSATADVAAAGSTAEDATPRIVAAANAFLTTLSNSEREAVLFDWTNTEQKQRWSNLPEGLYERNGLMWGDMSEAQQNAWLGLMQATLSTEGYNRVIAEWQADDVLTTGGGGGAPGGNPPPGNGGPAGGGPGQLLYGTQYYWIALIGTPSESDPWQWQWGGHHVTVNATVAGSNVVLTPSFIGCQPCTYTDANGNTVEPLGDIRDDAFALVNMLDATQQATAILGDTFIDLVLGPGEDGRIIQAEGLPAAEMTADQQAQFLQLISHYTGLVNDEDAASRLAEVASTLNETYFAWYGPTSADSAAYFRVTGPTIVIEYAPQSMGGNAADHIHGIYRDPINEYGVQLTQ